MTSVIYNALKDIGGVNIAIIFLIITLFIDITPGIKFNPVQFVIGKIGKAFNSSVDKKLDEFKGDVYEKIDNLEEKMDQRMDSLEGRIDELQSEQAEVAKRQARQERSLDEAEITRLKRAVLEFSNRLTKSEKFSAEEYHTVMEQYTRYHQLIDKYDDMQNGKIDIEYNLIVNHYKTNKECGEYLF